MSSGVMMAMGVKDKGAGVEPDVDEAKLVY